ncbi:MAG: transcription termination factor NusA [Candidatus Marinimicrobia bacterium]|nr:transcription termination factor NusA [Candidatus Neomarinimicrobiota bacterium]
MIQQEIIDAFAGIAREKNRDRTHLGSIIEELFMTLMEKQYGEDYENFSVIVNMDKGTIEIYQEKTVVAEVDDDVIEISLEDAQKLEPDLTIGDPFIVIIDPANFGRRLISAAKQFLSQKIREIEKQYIYDEYSQLVGTIASGDIHQIRRDNIFVNIDKVEMRLPKSEQIPNERYRRGSSIRGLIKSVELTAKGPDIILSRASDDFLIRLFEMEVPEIEDGIIEIKAIARAPGDRSKVVVFSHDKRIDAVGACVGMRGSRIQSVVRELSGEKIDIINWSDQPEILVSRALSPAKPVNLLLMEGRPYVMAVFSDEELPTAIGRGGQNIRLASEVTGYTIDAVKQSDYEAPKKLTVYLDEVPGISKGQVEALAMIDIHTAVDMDDLADEDLVALKGFGPKTVEKVRRAVEQAVEELQAENDSDEPDEAAEEAPDDDGQEAVAVDEAAEATEAETGTEQADEAQDDAAQPEEAPESPTDDASDGGDKESADLTAEDS